MEDSLPGALRKGDPAYPDADPSISEELDSLRRENMQYAEKLYRVNCENVALWDQLARLKRLLLEHRIPFSAGPTNNPLLRNPQPSTPPGAPGISTPLENASRRSSVDMPRNLESRRESSSRRESTASSRESRLSVAGAERPSESAPPEARRSLSATDLVQGELPPIKQRPPPRDLWSFSGELTPIGELTPNGDALPGGSSPRQTDPPERKSKLSPGRGNRETDPLASRPRTKERSSPISESGRLAPRASGGSSSDATEKEGSSPRGVARNGFSIRGSARIHPLGGDQDLNDSRRDKRSSAGLGGASTPTSAKRMRIRRLWQMAAAHVQRHKERPSTMHRWTAVIEKAKARKETHWTTLVTRPIQGNGRLRKYWDTLLMVCLLYIVVEVPYVVAFTISSTRSHNTAIWTIDWLLEVVFLMDIYINFRSTYVSRGKVVTDQSQIAVHYLRTWFVLDAISVIPIVTIVRPNHAATSLDKLPLLLKILRLNKLVKLVRVLRVSSTFEALENYIPHGLLTIFKFFLLMLAIGHVTACLFYFMAVLDNLDGLSWPAKEGLLEKSNFTKYVTSLYWAFSTLCTVGYGDVVPTTTLERLFAIAAMLVGATIFAYFMGNMSVLVANLDQEASRQERQMEVVNSFLRSRHIPKDLQTRVRDYYRYLWKHQVHSEENMIITGLNASLRTDVVLYMYREMLEKVPFFHGKPPQFISALVLCLRPEFYGPGDFIMREHDVGKDMYFIVEGSVHILSSRIGTIVKRPGEYFGEMALITGMRRSASCTSQTYCELYSLSKENLERVLQDWPEIAEDFYSQGLANMQKGGLTPVSNAVLQAAAAEETARKSKRPFEGEERTDWVGSTDRLALTSHRGTRPRLRVDPLA